MNNRTKQQVWILFKCVGVSVSLLLLINLVTFLLGLIFYGLNETWVFHFKQGAFSLNGRMIGLIFFEPAANGLMLILFIAALAQEFKQPPLINQSEEKSNP